MIFYRELSKKIKVIIKNRNQIIIKIIGHDLDLKAYKNRNWTLKKKIDVIKVLSFF